MGFHLAYKIVVDSQGNKNPKTCPKVWRNRIVCYWLCFVGSFFFKFFKFDHVICYAGKVWHLCLLHYNSTSTGCLPFSLWSRVSPKNPFYLPVSLPSRVQFFRPVLWLCHLNSVQVISPWTLPLAFP